MSWFRGLIQSSFTRLSQLRAIPTRDHSSLFLILVFNPQDLYLMGVQKNNNNRAVKLIFPDFTWFWRAQQRLAAVHLDWVLIVVGLLLADERQRTSVLHASTHCAGPGRAAASSECSISVTQTSPIPSSSRRLGNLSKVFAADEIIQKRRRAPCSILDRCSEIIEFTSKRN